MPFAVERNQSEALDTENFAQTSDKADVPSRPLYDNFDTNSCAATMQHIPAYTGWVLTFVCAGVQPPAIGYISTVQPPCPLREGYVHRPSGGESTVFPPSHLMVIYELMPICSPPSTEQGTRRKM